MGMFDDVRCEVPLPDGKTNAPMFQSKDLDCNLDKYTITKDGLLTKDLYRWDAPTEKYIRDGVKIMDFHGILNFYDYNDKTREWREFNAKFTNGRLVEIKAVTRRPTEEGR